MGKVSAPKSLNHGSTRVARLARWLGEPRPRGSKYNTLRLEVRVEGEWSCLQTWDGQDVGQHLAQTINDMAVDYASELGTFTIARAVWWSEELDKHFTSYDLRIAPEDVDGVDAGQSFAGDVQSMMIQTQRHLEFMARAHAGGIASAMQAMRDVLGSQKAELLETLGELASLRNEVFALRQEKADAENTADAALTRAEELAEEKESQEEQSNVFALVTNALQRQQKP